MSFKKPSVRTWNPLHITSDLDRDRVALAAGYWEALSHSKTVLYAEGYTTLFMSIEKAKQLRNPPWP